MKEKKYSIRRGLGYIAKGNMELAQAIRYHVNNAITNSPRVTVCLVLAVSVFSSVVFGMQCKYRQTTAEQQRDSLYLLVHSYQEAMSQQ